MLFRRGFIIRWFEENSVTLLGWIINFIVIYFTSVYGVRNHKKNLKFDEKHEAYKDICNKFSAVHEREESITEYLNQPPANEEDRNKEASEFTTANNEFRKALDKYSYTLSENERKKIFTISCLLARQGKWYIHFTSPDEANRRLGQEDLENVEKRRKKIDQEYSEFCKMID